MSVPAFRTVEARVLDAAKACCERWGVAKVTIDDIATEAGVSRATLYRMFPGGKDVLFDALRVDDLEELLVRVVVKSTNELRDDQHLATILASEPGEILGQLTVEGVSRITRVATLFLAPLVEPHLPRREAARLVDLLARMVISYFLAPSDHVDLGDPESARVFVSTHITPGFRHVTHRS